ncbi:hypothetical protein CF8_0163 [Aeromonas phage CF8]|nr:hypothetical protein CF8_0163 [Aeromonas phage CF8]
MYKAENIETTLGPVDVRVDLTAPQQSVTGQMLHKLMYFNTSLYELAPNPIGCPHSGGEHKLVITGPRQEVNAWLDLVAETYPTVCKMVQYVKRHIHKEYLHGDWRKHNRINIKLKTLQHLEKKDHQDQPVAVKWFQSELERFTVNQ